MCIRLSVVLLTLSFVVGCSGSDSAAPESTSAAASDSGEIRSVSASVTAEISQSGGGDDVPDGSRVSSNRTQEPEDRVSSLLAEMQQLQVSAGSGSQAAVDANGTIVLKATEVLKLTMQSPSRQQDFLAAVRHLLQARYQLALTGSRDDVDQLYSDVQALNDRDAESTAAAEGIYFLAKFSHTKARRSREGKSEWNISFSRWAREFATRFADQQERAISLLFGAGRSCEMTAATADTAEDAAMLRAEARLCYVLLTEKWPDSPQGREAVAVMRRLNLPGQQLSQFSGPTLDGATVRAEQFPGKVTLLYFWDSESQDFTEEWLPLLKKAESQLPADRFRFVGVNLDEDLKKFRDAVSSFEVPGVQICFEDEERRGWNSPLVRFWGVSQSPSVWLVDREGVVDAVDVRREELASRIRPLLTHKR